jgi:threonyl-tRNA synthetase
MNCPGHVQIFNVGQKFYRELPLRMAEFGACHRYEPSGALHGLMRVRAFTQDDAHIFCREDQIVEETARSLHRLTRMIHADLGMTTRHRLATRPEICARVRTSSGTRPRPCWPRPPRLAGSSR